MEASHTRPKPLARGQRLGRYEVIGLLAIGGMAELHLARMSGPEGFEKVVALKRILPQYADDPEFVEMFLDEARLAGAMQHPNVVQVYDVGEVDGSYYFTMEYVHGEPLSALLRQCARTGRGLRLGDALTIVTGVAAGLHYAHDGKSPAGQPLETVHRDVSPSNVMITYDGGVKIVDFGIAKAAARRSKTRAGVVKGKLAYMSPEQCRGDELDRRSDVFSIGILLFELTTGTPLFQDLGDHELAARLLLGQLPEPSKRRANYPPELERIVMRALAHDPEDRYQTALELQRDIEELARLERISLSMAALAERMRDAFPGRADVPLPAELLSERLAPATEEQATLASLTKVDSTAPATRPGGRTIAAAVVAAAAVAAVVAAVAVRGTERASDARDAVEKPATASAESIAAATSSASAAATEAVPRSSAPVRDAAEQSSSAASALPTARPPAPPPTPRAVPRPPPRSAPAPSQPDLDGVLPE